VGLDQNTLHIDLQFPAKGINLATELILQPILTTPAAVNVRTFEQLTQRGRGGSRPGLSKYVADKVVA
jgi:hypothetical protein